QGLPVRMYDFERDLLPEHLWLAALVDEHGIERAHRPFYELMDAVDEVWSSDYPAIGLLSDFGLIEEDRRTDFKARHADLIRRSFHDSIGRILAFYPEGPAYWLIDQDALAAAGPLDPDVELTKASGLVVKLLAAKDEFAGHARMMPL